jgi:PKD repeat protein
MRTRPYPNIAANNSYGPHRGRLYLVYASNNPVGNGNKPDIYCRFSDNNGTSWSSPVIVNDDANSTANHNWFPAIWCEKNTGRLYVSWMDTRDCPTADSCMIYASYSDDGVSFAQNQKISNKKMKINCSSCGGGGTPMYLGDYNGIAANEQGSMLAWTDFRDNNFGSYVGYFPDYAMRLTLMENDTLADSLGIKLEVPSVKLYTHSVEFSATSEPAPTSGSFDYVFPQGNQLSTFPGSVDMYVVKQGSVPPGTYLLTVTAKGPNGSPIHKRTQFFKVVNSAPAAAFAASSTGICQGTSVDFTDQSSGSPTAWEWTFQGGVPSSSTVKNPTGIVYSSVGSYDVTLKVTNSYGTNTSTQTGFITASVPPAAPTTTNMSVCIGSPVPSLSATGTEIKWYSDAGLTTQVGSGNTLITGQNQPGAYTYYATQSTVGCEGPSATATLNIYAKPEATLSDFDSTCSAYPAFDLVNGLPAGGVYSGNGVDNNMFAPTVAGTGVHEITYIYQDGNGCSDTATNTIKVNESPVTSLAAFNPVCANAASFTLTGGLPEGGTFSGTGVANGMFDPAVAGAGDHVIAYTIPPVGGCGGYSEQTITVYNIPAVNLGNDTSVCANHTITLDGTAMATSYLWSPGGATTSTVVVDSAGIGIGSVAYSVVATNDKNCSSSDEITVTFKDCTGIDEFARALNLNIYPNPGKGLFVIELNTEKAFVLDMNVTNPLGKQIFSDQNIRVNGTLRYNLDLSGQADGVYVLYIKDASSSLSRKIVIRK